VPEAAHWQTGSVVKGDKTDPSYLAGTPTVKSLQGSHIKGTIGVLGGSAGLATNEAE